MKLNNSAKLIQLVKQHSILYDSKVKDECSKVHKMKIWDEIARVLNYDNGRIAKTKWRNIRDSYMKHLKAVSEVQQQSADIPPRLVKYANWPWADQMQFLQLTSATRRSRSEGARTTETMTNDDELEQNDDADVFSDENETQNSFKNEDYDVDDIKVERTDTTSMIAEFSDTRPTIRSHDFDAVELLFLSYAKTLKAFSKRRQIETKMQIALVMNQAEVQELAECEEKC